MLGQHDSSSTIGSSTLESFKGSRDKDGPRHLEATQAVKLDTLSRIQIHNRNSAGHAG